MIEYNLMLKNIIFLITLFVNGVFMKNYLLKKVLLIQSIVGKDYIPKSVIDIFGRTKLFSETIAQVPFYILKIPSVEEYDSQIQTFFNTMIK